jgi:hypothetical protein
MFAASDTSWAPWYVAYSDDKKRARLNIITNLLDQIPYESLPKKKVALPEREIHDRVRRHSAPPPRNIPTPF